MSGVALMGCQFNQGVICSDWESRKCNKCGWNPVIAEARNKRIESESRKGGRNRCLFSLE